MKYAVLPIFILSVLVFLSLGEVLELEAEEQGEALTEGRAPGAPGRLGALIESLPDLRREYESVEAAEQARRRVQRQRNESGLLREKIEADWFAVLVDLDGSEGGVVGRRFSTWPDFLNFLGEHEALVDVWAYGQAGSGEPRRIPATELWQLKELPREQPVFVTVTYPEAGSGEVVVWRVEFGFGAAETVLAAHRSYLRHRELQILLHEVLSARDEQNQLNAFAQWEALEEALAEGGVTIEERPLSPLAKSDLFVAVEFEVDEWNTFSRVARLYREEAIGRRISRDKAGHATQWIELRRPGSGLIQQAFAYQRVGVTDQLSPAPAPAPGRDMVELRVFDREEPDPRRWNALEFGEPELIRQSALSQFSLISAHLEKNRKELALRKSRLDLYVEPLIAGLNIGGGIAGFGFPAGEVIRLPYNLAAFSFLQRTPKVREFREFFGMLAAREKDPVLRARGLEYLALEDIEVLRRATADLSDAEIQEHLERASEDDLQAMLRLARMQMHDARITQFLGVLASGLALTGRAESEILRDIFRSPYFSLSGEVSLKTLFAVAIGQRGATPFSGVSLEQLSRGEGPAKAWLQYFDLSVDIRAVANSLARLGRASYAEKELHKPFPYALRMTDLAAYEVRIFGYPLLIYYKRGLMKDDFRAFQEDYAYAVDGGKVLARIGTKEEFDGELRAGRMAPIGYVRVPDGRGGWQDTNLAVFVYQIPSGRHRGRPAIVIYGLKAYFEQSEQMQRELKRFRQFEVALRSGAVIEQTEEAEDGSGLSSLDYEPRINPGENANAEIYSPLLGGLIEMRRHSRRLEWGIKSSEEERTEVAGIAGELGRISPGVDQRSALLGVDRFSSSFRYKKFVDGKWQVVRMVSIPGLEAIERELAKAEEGWAIERLRHETAMHKNPGMVFINEAVWVDGRYEAGPLAAWPDGELTGVLSGAESMQEFLEWVQSLPVLEQARLKFNQFATTLIDLSLLEGLPRAGEMEATPLARELAMVPGGKVFITVEFPPGEVKWKQQNRWSGEVELQVYEEGLWTKAISRERILELRYNERMEEVSSSSYANLGTIESPVRGPLLEETRTLGVWHRDLNDPHYDRNAPLISKVRVNYVTGEAVKEIYGIHPFPLTTIDDQFITENEYDLYGELQGGWVRDNGESEEHFARSLAEKMLQPVLGKPRFRLEVIQEGVRSWAMSEGGRPAMIKRRDLVKGLETIEVHDRAHRGRKLQETRWEEAQGEKAGTVTRFEYRDDFHFGLVPYRSTVSSAASERFLSETVTIEFDPEARLLLGVEREHTGKSRTNLWDYRWEAPVRIDTAQRRTLVRHNREETRFAGQTTGRVSGEELNRFQGEFQVSNGSWEVERSLFHRPGVTNRVQTELVSGHGKLLAIQMGEMEARVEYDRDGIEQGRSFYRRPSGQTTFDLLTRKEREFEWENGRRRARVEIHLDGAIYDQYIFAEDEEGRIVQDQIRTFPGFQIETHHAYEGDSERLKESLLLMNKQIRAAYVPQPEVQQQDGSFVLPVRVAPAWGLVSTQLFVLGGLWNRPRAVLYENGERVEFKEWHEGTAIARVSETINRRGELVERRVRSLGMGGAVSPAMDQVNCYKIDPWGNSALAERQFIFSGTEVPHFTESGHERTYYDLSRPYPAPFYSVSLGKADGISVELLGRQTPRVIALHHSEPIGGTETAAAYTGRHMQVDKMDLRGLFFYRTSQRTVDAGGNVLSETTGRTRSLGQGPRTYEAMIKQTGQSLPLAVYVYKYEAGYLRPGNDPELGGNFLAYSRSPGEGLSRPVNRDGAREFLTEIEEWEIAGGAPSAGPERRSHSPVLLRSNPYMPGRSNAWSAWRTTELGPRGEPLFETLNIYDAAGNAATSVTTKRGGSGEKTRKTVHHVAPALEEEMREMIVSASDEFVSLDLQGRSDFSKGDFICFFYEVPAEAAVTFSIVDARGKRLVLGKEAPFWWANQANVKWIPDNIRPVQAAAVHEAGSGKSALAAFSVHQMAGSGLDVGEVAGIEARWEGPDGFSLRLSPVYQLGQNETLTKARSPGWLQAEEEELFSGIKRHSFYREADQVGGVFEGEGMNAWIGFSGLPVAWTHSAGVRSPFPHLVLVDYSDRNRPSPMYAIDLENGRFVEHYKSLRSGGNAHVYTIVQGFDLPKLEIFDPRQLEGESVPSVVAYGYNYDVRVRYAQKGGWLGQAAATLNNRIGANMFKHGGDKLLDLVVERDSAREGAARFHYAMLHHARIQAREIEEMPSLAEAVMPVREVPWKGRAAEVPGQSSLEFGQDKIGVELLRMYVRSYPAPDYGLLIPDALETEAHRFVDTVREAALIELAIQVKEHGLAGDLLKFYHQKSGGGQKALHTSYDAQAGTAMGRSVFYKRPHQVQQEAEAQIAIAQAAFSLGMETGDQVWFDFARNLLFLVIDEFRPFAPEGGPRGISERPYLRTIARHGVTFWPWPQRYSIRTNARAFLLLGEFVQVMDRLSLEEASQIKLQEAWEEQSAWLRTVVQPYVERTGVAPQGVFEIQDIHQSTTALAMEKSTSSEDWLAFIEAAHHLGVPPGKTGQWLENLARAHGVQINGRWGLDWTLPLLRPPAISPELTARFWRVARLIGHGEAEAFVLDHLREMQRGTKFPVVLTSARPRLPLPSGQGFFIHPHTNRLQWPVSYAANQELLKGGAGPVGNENRLDAVALRPRSANPLSEEEQRGPVVSDVAIFILMAAGFYLAVLASACFWWRFRALRPRQAPAENALISSQLVPEKVMRMAEERWAKRVLGMQSPAQAEKTRFSNGAVEQNFLMQLRAIYKLVLEWRRQENQWEEDDPRLVEDESDDWLNGMDEFASCAGIYMRWVIKAGAKDGFNRADVLEENEDSNHIWSRLVMYFSEHYWGMVSLMKSYSNLVSYQEKAMAYGQIAELLQEMGARRRKRGFDARELFNYPVNPNAMDLMVIQRPGMTLHKVLLEAAMKLKAPYSHLAGFVQKYKAFKKREQPYPIHPYIIEFAKLLPHFLLMGLGALIWHNHQIGDSPVVPYLWDMFSQMARNPVSWLWGLPLLGGLIMTVAAHFVRVYRFEGSMLPREKTGFFLDSTLTSLFVTRHSAMPRIKRGRWWEPHLYERVGWGLRAVGFLVLGMTLLRWETPSFATFLVVKGLLAMMAFTELASVVLPLLVSAASKFLQDRVTEHPGSGGVVHFLNRLNLTATRPASPLWLMIKYYHQPSVPSGDWRAMTQAMLFYFLLGGLFFGVGGYLCHEILSLWFTETYLHAENWKLFFGALLFWNTMYLLRYALFLLATGIASLAATYPVRACVGFLAGLQLFLGVTGHSWGMAPGNSAWFYLLVIAGLGGIFFEENILRAGRRWVNRTRQWIWGDDLQRGPAVAKEISSNEPETVSKLGVVYMGGDELSYLKLTPGLLMERWRILRDRLDSESLRLLTGMADWPDDGSLEKWFKRLYEAEQEAQVTLWHPVQIRTGSGKSRFPEELGLNLAAATEEDREQMLRAWHVRRWLATMMSTAGHSQDTGINLVDIALRLQEEGLGTRSVFYLIQNKYDDGEGNRPVQANYAAGELAQRNKLARLLSAIAPGVEAYNIQNWTPFGFKAGGLTGMDLVPEEILNLGTMVMLDRNATVHDLDALMQDVSDALADPEIIIVIPGRGTTNTLTPLGQASQLIEEGHRSFLKGLISLMGGRSSESVGTGWGNILGVFYGRMQRAMTDWRSLKMPLTSRMRRGSSFAARAEGLIGFTPHAVGISEDTWAVSQGMHNAIALGLRVKFRLSRAFWHKIRETWSHAEWLASFPRWSGGYLQMMHDPLMQKINDFGALSVFAKEMRANSGRNFLIAPFALLNILLMPLAIILDVTPFIQILIVLWNFGFIMNQVLTVHGLSTYLESSGFYRFSGLLGLVAVTLVLLIEPGWMPVAPGLVALACLYGGFFVGANRWFYTRIRDLILFGPQLVLHSLGQLMRQSLEFVLSGAAPQDAKGVNIAFRLMAGPREDRPLDTYPHLINLRTIVWGVGFLSVVLNLFALSTLDMLNVLLLLPSLLFSASALVGPFLLKPPEGKSAGNLVVVSKVLGWGAALLLFTAVSLLVAEGGVLNWIGLTLFLLVLAILAFRGARYLWFRLNVKRFRAELSGMLARAGVAGGEAERLAGQLLGDYQNPEQIRKQLAQLPWPEESQARVADWLRSQVTPYLQGPVADLNRGVFARERLASEWGRSFVLATFVFLWFFIVPVPGLLVFSAGAYRLSVELGGILLLISGGVGVVVAGYWGARFFQWFERQGWERLGISGLCHRIRQAYRSFELLQKQPGMLSEVEVAGVYGLFLDAKTYLDQRSYAYARRTLSLIEAKLEVAAGNVVKARESSFSGPLR